ncbi:MAG TPA: hypothetical protein VI456_15840, partial [Polyangia bacterium]
MGAGGGAFGASAAMGGAGVASIVGAGAGGGTGGGVRSTGSAAALADADRAGAGRPPCISSTNVRQASAAADAIAIPVRRGTIFQAARRALTGISASPGASGGCGT